MTLLKAVLLSLAFLLSTPAIADAVRLKDLVEIDGVRGNDLVGYGLVVGLNGSGDGIRNAPFTEEILANVLERLGINISGEQFRPKNVAAVLVTAALPAFARSGSRIDVSVSAIGDAKSLLGGTLIMTPMNAADGEVYAVAQGSVLAGGVSAEGNAGATTTGVPTSGSIPGGGRIEKEVNFDFSELTDLRLALRTPDFTTALRIEDAINRETGRKTARMLDSGTVQLDLHQAGGLSPAHFIGRIENLAVIPERKATVVIDQRSGTIVMGANVRISRVAVAQGNLTLRVEEAPIVVQPNPFADGRTVVVPRTEATVADAPALAMTELKSQNTLSEVVEGLNALGVGPRDMIDILKSIKAAGAIHADFVIQ